MLVKVAVVYIKEIKKLLNFLSVCTKQDNIHCYFNCLLSLLLLYVHNIY